MNEKNWLTLYFAVDEPVNSVPASAAEPLRPTMLNCTCMVGRLSRSRSVMSIEKRPTIQQKFSDVPASPPVKAAASPAVARPLCILPLDASMPVRAKSG